MNTKWLEVAAIGTSPTDTGSTSEFRWLPSTIGCCTHQIANCFARVYRPKEGRTKERPEAFRDWRTPWVNKPSPPEWSRSHNRRRPMF